MAIEIGGAWLPFAMLTIRRLPGLSSYWARMNHAKVNFTLPNQGRNKGGHAQGIRRSKPCHRPQRLGARATQVHHASLRQPGIGVLRRDVLDLPCQGPYGGQTMTTEHTPKPVAK